MIRNNTSIVVLVLAVLLFSSACATKVVRGVAPIVRINELSHTGDTISMQLNIRNLNGVDLDIQSIDINLSVDEGELFGYQGPADTSVHANGTETWTANVKESPSSKQLLDKLQAGDIKSLPYTLKGSITAVGEGKLQFNHEGHIYPVPGRPGHFR